MTVRRDVLGVGRVTSIAMHAKRAGKLLHNLVDLLTGQIFRQHLQVGGRGEVPHLHRWWTTGRWRSSLRGLGNGGHGEDSRGQQSCYGNGQSHRRMLQGKITSRVDVVSLMDEILTERDAFAD